MILWEDRLNNFIYIKLFMGSPHFILLMETRVEWRLQVPEDLAPLIGVCALHAVERNVECLEAGSQSAHCGAVSGSRRSRQPEKRPIQRKIWTSLKCRNSGFKLHRRKRSNGFSEAFGFNVDRKGVDYGHSNPPPQKKTPKGIGKRWEENRLGLWEIFQTVAKTVKRSTMCYIEV